MTFSYETAEQTVIFGAGQSERLPKIIRGQGWHKVLLCTSPYMQRSGLVDRLRSQLGGILGAVYDQTAAHVPQQQVLEVMEMMRSELFTAIVALGGGSVIGLGKAVSFALWSDGLDDRHVENHPLPILAVPTTYAGSEMTPVFGVTERQVDGSLRKVTTRERKISPRLSLYDPLLTLDLPPEMTAASGINALAHGIEAVYSTTRNALSTAAAVRAITRIMQALPECFADGNDIDARCRMMEGSHLAAVALATVSMGLHHGTGHVLGGTAGVPHGVANGIVLPHALRFNADTVPAELALVAEAMGIERDGRSEYEMALAAAATAEQLIGSLGMPQKLRDVGIDQALLPTLAQNLLLSKAVQANPKPLLSTEQAFDYLKGMW
ncbi:MAG: iron-containing alcohol dehydrogenase [Candidatus Promineifilaceae bacterium]|nr:iron-containing alcohol dehydrogenase [Candidatus Promineifilaceae bacterium]